MDNLDTYAKKTLLEKTEGAIKNRQTRENRDIRVNRRGNHE